MKNFFYLFLIIAIPSIAICQNSDPHLIRTWYLNEFLPSDAYNEPFIISELELSSTPTLTFVNENELNGLGACNSFSAEYSLDETNSFIVVEQFSSTDMSCDNPTSNAFESAYFSTIQNNAFYIHEISQVTNGYKLEMHTAVFGYAIFYSSSLAIEEINPTEPEVTLYPNPASSFINIDSPHEIKAITILNSQGRIVKTIKDYKQQINLLNLETGIYFVKFKSNNKTFYKKFIIK